MLDLYAVTATIQTKGKGKYKGMRQIPTFYLCANVQGITDAEHAKRIALDVIDPTGTHTVHVHTELVTL